MVEQRVDLDGHPVPTELVTGLERACGGMFGIGQRDRLRAERRELIELDPDVGRDVLHLVGVHLERDQHTPAVLGECCRPDMPHVDAAQLHPVAPIHLQSGAVGAKRDIHGVGKGPLVRGGAQHAEPAHDRDEYQRVKPQLHAVGH